MNETSYFIFPSDKVSYLKNGHCLQSSLWGSQIKTSLPTTLYETWLCIYARTHHTHHTHTYHTHTHKHHTHITHTSHTHHTYHTQTSHTYHTHITHTHHTYHTHITHTHTHTHKSCYCVGEVEFGATQWATTIVDLYYLITIHPFNTCG